jgi:hypothetical protein
MMILARWKRVIAMWTRVFTVAAMATLIAFQVGIALAQSGPVPLP